MPHDVHTLAGAYAMDALTDTERRRFERHLAGCATCAQEARELRETTARLAIAGTRQPPPGLHDRVLADIQQTRQLPPRLPRHRPFPHTGWLLAAACLVLALISATVAVNTRQDAQQTQALNRQVAAVLAAPDARAVTSRVPGSGAVTVVTARSLDKAVITASDLPPLPGDRTYQLWRMGPEPPLNAGLLPAAASSPARPVITTGLTDIRYIGLSVEPTGGSPQPTSAPILTLRLS